MKKLLTILFAVALGLNLSAQVPDYVPTDGLVAWYPLDAGTYEISDLMPLHPPINSENRFGAVDGSTFFDGNQELTTPGISYYDFTISTWFLSNDVEEDVCGGIVSQNTGLDCTPLVHIAACYSPMALHCQVRETNCVADQVSADLSPLFWQHLVFHREGNLIRTYLNGVLAEEDSAIQDEIAPDVQLRIGAMPYGGQFRGFHGSIDDIGIWNRALTEEEILALYNAEPPVTGCTDPTACNFDAETTSDDGSCIPSGCMDSEACNYNALAECEGEACHYTCCPGPGCCLEGTVWDAELGGCIPMETNCPEDLDFDGAVGINDLMELLSAFGTYCPPEVTGWTCGDPVSYHGYDYATVKIGEQCWFAENLRAENYLNGDPIPDNLTNSEWVSTSQGARGIYVDSESGIVSHTYNGYAVQDERGVCPESWHVPSDLEWMELELYIGLDESEGEVLGLRGNHGALLKSSPSDVPSWDGTNELSFKGLPSWGRGGGNGTFGGGTKFKGWSSTVAPSGDIWLRNLLDSNSGVERDNDNPHNGCNVRCLKD